MRSGMVTKSCAVEGATRNQVAQSQTMKTLCPAALFVLGLILLFPAAARAPDEEAPHPINLDKVNTDQDEDEPHLTSSGLQLYYASSVNARWEIRVAQRRLANQPWPPGKPFFEFKGKADYRSAFQTLDGRYPQRLYFAT